MEPTREEHQKEAPLQGRLLALPTNIRLGWKGLPGTNTLAFYEHLLITDINIFMTLGPGITAIIPFSLYLYSLVLRACVFYCGKHAHYSQIFSLNASSFSAIVNQIEWSKGYVCPQSFELLKLEANVIKQYCGKLPWLF
jgi:hypothetical protein